MNMFALQGGHETTERKRKDHVPLVRVGAHHRRRRHAPINSIHPLLTINASSDADDDAIQCRQ